VNNINDQIDATIKIFNVLLSVQPAEIPGKLPGIRILLIFESAEHVSGNLLPIFRSVRLWFTPHCCKPQFYPPEDGQKIVRNTRMLS
jgi:hypothetical protein